ncbi:MAG: S8 family serine peptidase, partial [Phycisphaerales bacterium]
MTRKMTGRANAILLRRTILTLLLWVPTPALLLAAPAPKPGTAAVDFELADLDGQTVSLSALAGHNIVLLFGTTSCPHCQAALSALDSLYESGPEELRILFICVGQSAGEVLDSFGGHAPGYDVLLDETGSISRRYGIRRVPTCVFIDQDGVIQHVGRFSTDIVWRLLSGERPIYPDRLDRDVSARDRLKRRIDRSSAPTKRFIVEIAEEPKAKRRLSGAALKSRRAQLRQAAERLGARVIHDYGKLRNRIVLELPPEKVERLRELPRFKSAEEDRRVHVLLEDSAYQIKADYAWDNAITGQGIKVCVVDTGIDYTHPDLLGKVVAQYDFTTNSDNAMDDNGHGTHVAGIIASKGQRYRGVAHDVSLMGAKTLDSTGSGHASDVMLGINWCVEQGADVINLSVGEGLFSGTCDYDGMAMAVNQAVDAGVIVVCAAGNDGDSSKMVSPACASKAIAVGAVDKIDNITTYSDGGEELDLVAPGGEQFGGASVPEIVSAYSTAVADNPLYCMYLIADECLDNYFVVEGTRYIRAVGTSMASPHVAGAAALLLEENPYLTPSQVKTVLEENADDLGPPGWDNVYGWGRINLEKALDNIPLEPAELVVNITEPNVTDTITVHEGFGVTAEVDCFGGDGCGDVLVYAQFCSGLDCNDFVDVNATTVMSTLDDNPDKLGILSGYTVETDVPVVFDVQTMLDISEDSYTKSLNPESSLVGSTLPTEYNTGDLEPRDGIGAIGEDAQELYEFELPAGVIRTLKVRMENYLVMHFDYPDFAGWHVYTSNADGDSLRLVGECTPAEGGGGEVPSPDCWFISDDPAVLADLDPGGTNYIRLVSHDVGENDWLTFNDIEVIVEYELDPNNDQVYEYYVKFDLTGIDPADELTAARLKINIAQGAEKSIADIYLVDNTLLAGDQAQAIHEAYDASYSGLVNPIKSISCAEPGLVSLNVKAAVEEALLAGQNSIALQFAERNNDQLLNLSGQASPDGPVLTISQKVQQRAGEEPAGGEPADDPNSGPRTLSYDTVAVKDVSEDSYVKNDSPSLAQIGAEFASEYKTGDLEPRDGIGAIGDDAQEHYEFEIPQGAVKTLKIRIENYLVMHFDYPEFAGWYIYTSNPDGDNLHLVGECTPAEGGGGEPAPPDCWFISDDPVVLADLQPGSTNYIKLVSHDVGENDWLTFNDIEVTVEYQVDPNNDEVSRYYVKFDISDMPRDAEIDSATLSLNVAEPAANAVAQISLVDGTYDSPTGAATVYNADDADYSSLVNPIKSIACDSPGLKQLNVRAALEDAVESDIGQVAFLIAEQDENQLFTLGAGGGQNPPRLDVYLKSGISGGVAQWTLTPNENGPFTLRILASNNVGIAGLSDAMVVNVEDPNLPSINGVECLIDSVWQSCTNAQYADILQEIRIDASDRQETPDVHLKLTNIPDNQEFVDEQLTYSQGYFTHKTNLEISDSGQWQIQVICTDSDGNSDTETVTWNIPWGTLQTHLISPTTNITVPKSGTFLVETAVECFDAECPQAKGSLRINDPTEIKYDDATAEDYGD